VGGSAAVQRAVSDPKQVAIGQAVVEQGVDLNRGAGIGLKIEAVEVLASVRDEAKLIAATERQRVVTFEIERCKAVHGRAVERRDDDIPQAIRPAGDVAAGGDVVGAARLVFEKGASAGAGVDVEQLI